GSGQSLVHVCLLSSRMGTPTRLREPVSRAHEATAPNRTRIRPGTPRAGMGPGVPSAGDPACRIVRGGPGGARMDELDDVSSTRPAPTNQWWGGIAGPTPALVVRAPRGVSI